MLTMPLHSGVGLQFQPWKWQKQVCLWIGGTFQPCLTQKHGCLQAELWIQPWNRQIRGCMYIKQALPRLSQLRWTALADREELRKARRVRYSSASASRPDGLWRDALFWAQSPASRHDFKPIRCFPWRDAWLWAQNAASRQQTLWWSHWLFKAAL